MKYTSSEAGKLLKKLGEEQRSMLLREDNGKEFFAAVGRSWSRFAAITILHLRKPRSRNYHTF